MLHVHVDAGILDNCGVTRPPLSVYTPSFASASHHRRLIIIGILRAGMKIALPKIVGHLLVVGGEAGQETGEKVARTTRAGEVFPVWRIFEDGCQVAGSVADGETKIAETQVDLKRKRCIRTFQENAASKYSY